MPPDRDRSKPIIFVGNIPYGLTEEQITEIFNSAGRVVSFRLVYDRETGRPKGFGFAEYSDHETAASAVRNLDNYEIMGRKLRVDFSHEGNADDEVNNSGPGPSSGGGGGLPPLPSGTDVPAGLSAPDAISQTLKALPVPQLLDILGQMKTLVSTDPIKATDLLRAAPQLSYAIFQALLLMNLVDTSVLTQVIENAATSGPGPAPPIPTAAPTGGFYTAPQSVPPPVPTPVPTYAPPPPAPAPVPTPVSQPPQTPQDPQRAALLQQVMSLTPEQISALPTEQQTQIILLKRQLLQGGGF